jgi:Heavy metal binding domain
MKTLKGFSLLTVVLVFCFQLTQGQALDYKGHKIDATGKITDASGKHVGNVTKDGVITDATGAKVAYTDGNGSLIDGKTGKNLGKIGKNGNFVSYSGTETLLVSEPQNGICMVKDKDGNIKAEVHETYKNVGACAVHCMTHNMKHGEVLNEEKANALSYSCPMHPEVTSDKAGKCSKCGMALVKKGS